MSKVAAIKEAPPATREGMQDAFLSVAIALRAPAVAYLRNSVKPKGRIVGYDAYALLIESRGVVQPLYKTALVTMVAQRWRR